jgi:hypothetical protein
MNHGPNAATACKSYTHNAGLHENLGHKRPRSSAQMQQTLQNQLENNDWGTFAKDYAQGLRVKSKLERRNWEVKAEFNKWKTLADEQEGQNII